MTSFQRNPSTRSQPPQYGDDIEAGNVYDLDARGEKKVHITLSDSHHDWDAGALEAPSNQCPPHMDNRRRDKNIDWLPWNRETCVSIRHICLLYTIIFFLAALLGLYVGLMRTRDQIIVFNNDSCNRQYSNIALNGPNVVQTTIQAVETDSHAGLAFTASPGSTSLTTATEVLLSTMEAISTNVQTYASVSTSRSVSSSLTLLSSSSPIPQASVKVIVVTPPRKTVKSTLLLMTTVEPKATETS